MFRLASSNITHTQAYDRSGRRATAPARIIGAAAIALFASANTFPTRQKTRREWRWSTMPVLT